MSFRRVEITDIEGFRVGNAEDIEGATGCTVVVCEDGATAGVDVRGGGPATRETDLLAADKTVQKIHAVVLSGGSAFGLEAASGTMEYLEEKGIGFPMGELRIPIVSQAALFDLGVGSPKARPDKLMGKIATANAFKGVFPNGNHGAGTGATVGKACGMDRAMKAGLGTYACTDDILYVGAVTAVNALGDIRNDRNEIIAGLLDGKGTAIYGTTNYLKNRVTLGDASASSDTLDALKAGYADSLNDVMPAMSAPDIIADDILDLYLEQAEERDSEGASARRIEMEAGAEPMPAKEEEQPSEITADREKVDRETVECELAEREISEREEYFYDDAAEHFSNIFDEGPEVSAQDEEEVAATAEEAAPESDIDKTLEMEPADDFYAAEEPVTVQPDDRATRRYELSEDDLGYKVPFNTTISCLMTNAKLTKTECNRLATVLHDGYARAVKPVHGSLDGDTIFVMSTGKVEVDFDAFAALATDIVQYSIIDGALSASDAYGFRSAESIHKTV